VLLRDTISRIDQIKVSFTEYRLFCRALLQKRRIISSILLTKAAPYQDAHVLFYFEIKYSWWSYTNTLTHECVYVHDQQEYVWAWVYINTFMCECVCVCPASLQGYFESSIHTQKSPVNSHKSRIHSQKSPIHTRLDNIGNVLNLFCIECVALLCVYINTLSILSSLCVRERERERETERGANGLLETQLIHWRHDSFNRDMTQSFERWHVY